MVTYQKWTEIGFRIAKQKGMRSSQENSQELVSLLAKTWNQRKETLNAATVAQAEKVANDVISIR